MCLRSEVKGKKKAFNHRGHREHRENINSRSHALRGNACLDALRRVSMAESDACYLIRDAERRTMHSHAERGNEDGYVKKNFLALSAIGGAVGAGGVWVYASTCGIAG